MYEKLAKTIRRSTMLTGQLTHTAPHTKLTYLYSYIERALVKCPDDSNYRIHTDAIIQQRKAILQSTQSIREIECLVNCGRIEELIAQAQRELFLIQKLLFYKPWEPLVSHPPKDQWKWPPGSTT